MNGLDLSSLDGLVLTVPAEKAVTTGGVKIERVPTEHALRLFKTGALYPSEKFAVDYNLQYQPNLEVVDALGKTVKVETGNGLDIFKFNDWGMIAIDLSILVVAITPKAESKVDVWGRTTLNAEGKPTSSVFTQGVTTFGKNYLVDMVATVYGIDWATTDYVEFDLEETKPLVSPNGKYYLPTIVSRGENKGKAAIKTRENITVFPLVIGNIKEAVAVTPVVIGEVLSEDLKLPNEPVMVAEVVDESALGYDARKDPDFSFES